MVDFKNHSNPKIIKNGASQVTAVLLYDSNGVYHDPANGKLPDGIPVTFTGSNGTFNPTSGILVDGQAKSLFTANVEGKTTISTPHRQSKVSIIYHCRSCNQQMKSTLTTLQLKHKINKICILFDSIQQYQCNIQVYL